MSIEAQAGQIMALHGITTLTKCERMRRRKAETADLEIGKSACPVPAYRDNLQLQPGHTCGLHGRPGPCSRLII